jgi:F-type H+-transporting ATPase subunit b
MEINAEFWAIVSLLVFLGLLVYLKVPQMIGKTLDKRIAEIEKDLEEARRLREEAQALLAEYERKRKAAESEAEDIIAAARDDAERLTQEAGVSLEEMIARRTRAVEEKIAQAEAHALGEVRSRSVDVAAEAARVLLTKQVEEKGGEMVDQAIKEVSARLN